jgi:NDP-sugar pyrophosphorylase family protein
VTKLADIDVVILAGGLGTRLEGVVSDRPKVLALVDDRPFLEFQLNWLAGFGVQRVILSIGYKADQVEAFAGNCLINGLSIETVREAEPLGTAGAIRNARPLLKSETVMIMNGDSFVDAPLEEFVVEYEVAVADASLLCAYVADAGRYGSVDVEDNGVISAFREKNDAGEAGYINAGIYLFGQAMLDRIDATGGPSLEQDVFQVASAGTLHGFKGEYTFLDIGTPEDYARAPSVLGPYMTERKKVTA